jgi:regulator of sigma E protease
MFIHGVDRPTYLDSAVIGVVVPNSAAASSGFSAGDSIVAVNGERIDTWEQVETRLAQQLRSYTLTVRRGGETLDLNLPIERTGARIPTDPTGGILPAVTQPVIGGITQGGSADKILAVGDTVLSVNGTPIVSFEQLSFIIRDYTAFDFPPPGAISPFDNFTFTMRGCDPGSKSIRLAVKRGEKMLDLDLIPVYNPNLGRYLLGIQQTALGPTRQVRYGPIAAIGPTMAKTWEFTMMIFDVLGKLTRGAVPADQLAGPLNIIPMSGLLVFMGLSHILNFMALIGVNLAVLNLLPLVITDGGLLMFWAIEAARGKPLSAKTQGFINKVFIALFLGLFVFISFNDTQRLPGFFKMFR